jgi:ABC-type siderophore export system fused ATPase/permease subunit
MCLLLVACIVYLMFLSVSILALTLIVLQDKVFDGWSHLLTKLNQWWMNTTVGCLNLLVVQLQSTCSG